MGALILGLLFEWRCRRFNIAHIPFGTSRHVSTRYFIKPIHLRIMAKWRNTYSHTCRACPAARRDTFVTTSATGANRTTRFQGRRHSVDWGGHVQLTFSGSRSWDRCKSRAQKTKLVQAITTASSSSAILKQARLVTFVTTRATRTTRRTCRVVSRRDVTSQVEFGLIWRHELGLYFHASLAAVRRKPLATLQSSCLITRLVIALGMCTDCAAGLGCCGCHDATVWMQSLCYTTIYTGWCAK